ncbi:MAG: hypothetical protein AVDCRST_MAG96-329 [uncultured Segetibacter sp.]|uniref:Uncharacterized protein n=1 Tax=uncultured Segetibacter sp. TaxID=481133 RepID=A0A6J4RDJ5_9BACT|nr:MAG: hypothetical protein AVDCRST_MAG96-329 [uncultured Segetibacter sp.]
MGGFCKRRYYNDKRSTKMKPITTFSNFDHPGLTPVKGTKTQKGQLPG